MIDTSFEFIFVLQTWAGKRAFTKTMPRADVQDQMLETYPTLLSVGRYAVSLSPLGPNLLGSLGYTQRPQVSVRLRHEPRGLWYQIVDHEALFTMPAAVFVDVGRQFTMPLIAGTVGSYRMDDATVELIIGDFARNDERDR